VIERIRVGTAFRADELEWWVLVKKVQEVEPRRSVLSEMAYE
jgi:hypothetical protein